MTARAGMARKRRECHAELLGVYDRPAARAYLCHTAAAAKDVRQGANEERTHDEQGYEFQVPDIDNVPNLHGNAANCADRTLAS